MDEQQQQPLNPFYLGLVAFLLPPVAVALVKGCGGQVAISIVLMFLFHIPAVIHAFFICFRSKPELSEVLSGGEDAVKLFHGFVENPQQGCNRSQTEMTSATPLTSVVVVQPSEEGMNPQVPVATPGPQESNAASYSGGGIDESQNANRPTTDVENANTINWQSYYPAPEDPPPPLPSQIVAASQQRSSSLGVHPPSISAPGNDSTVAAPSVAATTTISTDWRSNFPAPKSQPAPPTSVANLSETNGAAPVSAVTSMDWRSNYPAPKVQPEPPTLVAPGLKPPVAILPGPAEARQNGGTATMPEDHSATTTPLARPGYLRVANASVNDEA